MGTETPLFTAVRTVRTHEEVVRQVEEFIVDGRLGPGDRLPGERQMAESFGVSRASVREAMRVLESMEIIRVGRGNGAESGAVIVSQAGSAMSSLLRMSVALKHFSMDEVVATRVLLETHAAQDAAMHGSDAELARICDAMDDPSLSIEQFNELDTEFHVAIAEASGNRLVAHMMQAIRHAIRHEMTVAFAARGDWTTVAKRLRKEHRAIVDAIRLAHPADAAAAVERHITRFYKSVKHA